MTELGLFPLPVVLLPTERIPLHIFEPRYRELIDECLATGSEFGLVFATEDGAVHEIGTRATVEDVLEEPDGGRLDVVIEGRERFRLLELTSGRAFTTALVERVIDDEDAPHQPLEVTRALEAFTALVAETESPVDVPQADSPLVDFELAARVDFAPDAKQELLASTSPSERLERLTELLEIALEAVRLEKTLRDRAGKNGKVTPLDLDTDAS
ncbi:MAG TPA: LON peptidase substrate-binding domain-containing protein [Gaiellaceae bacterium]|jgi:Lon protease-like protein|nr:LON peptidase substrate-binding domain-containing protein [Gaiellaceae bacterium]